MRFFETSGGCARQRNRPGLGKGVVRRKLTVSRAREIWEELALLPIRQSDPPREVPKLIELTIRHNIGIYDACYLHEALVERPPLPTNDHDLKEAAESYSLTVITP